MSRLSAYLVDRFEHINTEKLGRSIALCIWFLIGFSCLMTGAYLLWGWAGWLFTLGVYLVGGMMYDRLIEVLK